MDRRGFLRLSSFSAGCWVLSNAFAQADGAVFRPSPLIRIDGSGRVTLFVQKQEMGQGVMTALPMLLAEELEVELRAVVIEALPYDPGAANGFNTWASASVRGAWSSLRKMAAGARMMLAQAAAERWGVPVEQVRCVAGTVRHPGSGAALGYGELAEAASRLAIPADPPLKAPADFTIIGKAAPRHGVHERISGQTVFGLDASVPDMVHAVVLRAPTFHGTVRSIDDSAVRALGAGILDVVPVRQMPGCDNRNGVAVVATSTWLAIKAQGLLKVEWELGPPLAHPDSAALAQAMRAAVERDAPAQTYDAKGRSRAFAPIAGKAFSADYALPFLHQAPMETISCIARWDGGRGEMWGGFQAPSFIAGTLAKAFGLDRSALFVHLLPMGGAFGRKEKVDNAAEALQLARHLKRPVKLMFTRTDEVRNGFYRPATWHRLSARITPGGIEAWRHQAALASFPGKTIGSAQHIYGGLSNDLVYPVGDYQTALYPVESPLPIGSWRSISYSQNVFAVEAFIDELARHARRDPVRLRLDLLRAAAGDARLASHRARMHAVLARCAQAIGWPGRPARGRHRGIACSVYTHAHAYAAHAFEISVSATKQIRIHRAVCAIDCGVVIDPSGFRAQVEGSLAWGLSAAMHGEITVKDGMVEQQNFSDYQVTRLAEMPALEIIVIDSLEAPSGAGEPAVPSVAPALANAVLAATGKPVRALPLAKAGFSWA